VQDVAQEVHVEIVGRLPAFQYVRPGAFSAWVRTILKHKLADYFRRRSHQPSIEPGGEDRLAQIPSPPEPDEAGPAADWSEQQRRRRAIKSVRARVKSQTWKAFARVARGGTVTDVARELGVSANTVRSACRRVRALLHKVLDALVTPLAEAFHVPLRFA
jgi:RNA polymerase sigma factor (sigma-70 family)